MYDAAGNIIELKIERAGSCPTGGSSKCAQWFAYDWDEVGQLVHARRWDFATLPVLAEGELPADAPERELRYAYSLAEAHEEGSPLLAAEIAELRVVPEADAEHDGGGDGRSARDARRGS